jgi:hypothetical protein
MCYLIYVTQYLCFLLIVFLFYFAFQCVDVIHPGKANIPKTEVAQKVAQMYKVQQACVMVRLTTRKVFFLSTAKHEFLILKSLLLY